MTKSTPLARGVRTFMFSLASGGALAALVQVNWFDDWKVGGIAAGIALITAIIAGVAAFLLAMSESWQAKVQTPAVRAVVTALQQFGAGLAAIAIVNLDSDVLLSVGKSIAGLAASAVLAAILTYAQNSAEGTVVRGTGTTDNKYGVPRA